MRNAPSLSPMLSAPMMHKLSHAFVTYIFPDASDINRVRVRAFSRKWRTTHGFLPP
jgi:hypothetical protein